MGRLAVVSLFSGAGGLDLGFAQTGLYEVVFANDILAPAVRTYSRNFGLKLVACEGDKTAEALPGTALECDVERVDF
ncbi:MAG: DNA cytosine methyltransferase, partial [Acidilobus sp.]|nr:DNA cytosine methyltransferase [Acidilobus sp.]